MHITKYKLNVYNNFAKVFFYLSLINYALCAVSSDIVEKNIPHIEYTYGENSKLLLKENKISALAVFYYNTKWYVVWDCGDNQDKVTIPSQNNLPVGFISFSLDKSVLTSKECVIFTLDIHSDMMPLISRVDGGWGIQIVEDYFTKVKAVSNQLLLDKQKLGRTRIVGSGRAMPVFLTMPSLEILSVIPTIEVDNGIPIDSTEYLHAFLSVQGVALFLKASNVVIDRYLNDMLYIYPGNPIMYSVINSKNDRDTISKFFIQKGSPEPWRVRQVLRAKIASDQEQAALISLQKAWLETGQAMGEEAKHTLDIFIEDFPKLTSHRFFMFLNGYTRYLSQDYQDSLDAIKYLPKVPEVEFLRKLNLMNLEKRVVFDYLTINILQAYPIALRDYIFNQIVPYLFLTDQLNLLKEVLNSVTPKNGKAAATSDFYRAILNIRLENEDFATRELSLIAKNRKNYPIPAEFKVEADFHHFMQKQIEKKSDEEIIEKLDVMRSLARGYNIEVQISMTLIEYLRKKERYVEIFEILESLKERFHRANINLGLNYLLNEYIIEFFNLKLSKVSPIRIISIFEKYRPDIEKNKNFEAIAEKVANLYYRLDLLPQAANLYHSISQYTQDTEKKRLYNSKVGNIYLQDYRDQEALDELEKLYKEEAHPEQKSEFALMIAKAYFRKKEYEKAIGFLRDHPSKNNKRFIAMIQIEKQDYLQTIKALENYLQSLDSRSDDQERQSAIVELAAAHRLQGNHQYLQKLYNAHKKIMENSEYAEIFAMLCRKQAKDIKTSDELEEYINDGDAIKQVFDDAQKNYFAEKVTTG